MLNYQVLLLLLFFPCQLAKDDRNCILMLIMLLPVPVIVHFLFNLPACAILLTSSYVVDAD